MLRALQAILRVPTRLTLRCGVSRGPVFAGEIGATDSTHICRDGRDGEPRRSAGGAGGGGPECSPRPTCSSTRGPNSRARSQPYLVKGVERPVVAYTVGAPTSVSETGRGNSCRLSVANRNSLPLRQAVEVRPRRGSSSSTELVGEPGIGKSRLVAGAEDIRDRVPTARSSLRGVREHARILRRPLAAAAARWDALSNRSQPGGRCSASSGSSSPLFPELAPWLPLLAIPFDAEVDATPESDAIDAKFRRDKLHDVVYAVHGSGAAHADPRPSSRTFTGSTTRQAFLLKHIVASALPRPWLICVTRRPEGESFSANGGTNGSRSDFRGRGRLCWRWQPRVTLHSQRST